MKIENEVNPPLDDALTHYGVMGMKWGVRKDRSARPTNQQIKTARKSVLSKRAEEQRNAPTRRAKTSIGFLGEASKHLSDEYRANPERAIAFRMTTGQKAAQTFFALSTAGNSLPITALNTAISSGIARDQRRAAGEERSRPTSAQIKTARESVLSKRAEEQRNAPTRRAKTSIGFLGEASKHLSDEYRANPERAIAFRATRGQKALQTFLALSSGGASLPVTALNTGVSSAIARDQRRVAARTNK